MILCFCESEEGSRALPDDPYLIFRSVPRILEKPKDRLYQSIAGTEELDLPKWLEPYRDEVTWATRYLSECGAVPLVAFGVPSWMVVLKDWKLDPRKRKSFWFHVEQFQKVLVRSKSELAGDASESTSSTKVALHGSHGRITRNTSSNTPKNQAFFTFHL